MTYVYCVVRAAKAPRTSRVPRGLVGMSAPRILPIDGDLYAIVATAPEDRYGEAAINRGLSNIDWVSRAAVAHEAVVEHSGGRVRRVALGPNRPVGAVTRDVLRAFTGLGGTVSIDFKPQETPWTTPLDEDEEHATYDTAQVAAYFEAATRAALVLAALRAPFRGRSTPVNAWWGSFDLAVSLFSGLPAEPPAQDFITRNAMDAQEIAVGWWPGDHRYPRAAFYAYAHPAPETFASATLAPAGARWEEDLGEYVYDWEAALAASDPHRAALEFARSVVQHACAVCGWDPPLAASAGGVPSPIG